MKPLSAHARQALQLLADGRRMHDYGKGGVRIFYQRSQDLCHDIFLVRRQTAEKLIREGLVSSDVTAGTVPVYVITPAGHARLLAGGEER